MAMKIEHESTQFRRTDGVRVTRETWTFRDLELGASYWQVIGESAAEWATWVALHDGLVMVEVHTDRDGTPRITRGRARWDALPPSVREHLPQIHDGKD